MSGIIVKIYAFLLGLYPLTFRKEFREQMLLDFSDLIIDAESQGKIPLLLFCLRELVDFPSSLLKAHLKDVSISKMLRSQPINHALRGAFGYGVVFGLAFLISQFILLKLFIADNSMVGNLQVFFFDLFHTEHGLELIGWLPDAIASLLTGLVLGILFSVLFADRSSYRRYVLAGMLGWFLHDAVTSILWSSANLGFFLGNRHTLHLGTAESILSGAFLALTFVVAKSEKRETMLSLVIGSFACPLLAYFYLQLLFKLSIVDTPWMFMALMVLMMIYIGSVFVIALRSGVARKGIWMIVAGAFGHPLLPYAAHIFVALLALLIPFPVIPHSGLPVGSATAWRLFFRIALDNSIFGLIFGLFMGGLFGLQKKNGLPQLTT